MSTSCLFSGENELVVSRRRSDKDRRPRRHPKVQQPLKVLVECVRRMPSTGTLFTSQSPLFPVFIMGFVAVDEDDRDVARKWFETVLSYDTSRSVGPSGKFTGDR
jgi:hypothetical protein